VFLRDDFSACVLPTRGALSNQRSRVIASPTDEWFPRFDDVANATTTRDALARISTRVATERANAKRRELENDSFASLTFRSQSTVMNIRYLKDAAANGTSFRIDSARRRCE
jgi:hypothetical protein